MYSIIEHIQFIVAWFCGMLEVWFMYCRDLHFSFKLFSSPVLLIYNYKSPVTESKHIAHISNMLYICHHGYVPPIPIGPWENLWLGRRRLEICWSARRLAGASPCSKCSSTISSNSRRNASLLRINETRLLSDIWRMSSFTSAGRRRFFWYSSSSGSEEKRIHWLEMHVVN